MANNYPKTYDPMLNNILEQIKKQKDKISSQEWDTIVNILKAQTNDTATQLKLLHDFVTGGNGDGDVTLRPGYTSIVEALNSTGIAISDVEPEDKNENNLWLKIL